MHNIALSLLLSFLLILPAYAQETEAKAETDATFVYERDYCDFSLSFPEEPLIEQNCKTEDECYEVVTFSQIVDVTSSIHFRITCNPAEKGTKEAYSEEIMKETLKTMLAPHDLEIHKISSREFDHAKHAGLLGFGMREQNEKMLLIHLWIGENSIFTLEAELSGPENDITNKILADTLRSITIKQDEKN